MSKHDQAIDAFQQGRLEEAAHLFDELLKEQESSELWNDWATVQLACGNVSRAETGLIRALELDPQNYPAKADLGILLLGQGNHSRAISLIRESLRFLPAQQQEVLRVALQATEHASTRILMIHDSIPQVTPGHGEPHLLRVVCALRELGHEVTLISRAEGNPESLAQQQGMKAYAADSERLPALGLKIEDPGWRLESILREGRFDLAILTQTFSGGISIPEHYLHAIRRYSPQTRIAILSEGLQGAKAAARAEASGEFRHSELAEDWTQREWEAFKHADLVLSSHADDVPLLREQQIQVVLVPRIETPPAEVLRAQLSQALLLASQLAPKPLPKGLFSMTLVDAIYAQLLEQTSGEARVYARLDFYIQLAEQLLRHGKIKTAREQLRHIFGWLGDSAKLAPALAQPLGLLKRCYRELGDQAMAERCGIEARRCFRQVSHAGSRRASGVKRKKDQPLISLIVPTYNRLPILKKCLAALEAQTASQKDFEVIVIDDGSSDGTEEFMREHKAKFHLQSLRQKNSGTGTARRHGVEHATGEYLLLMNDDTIFDPAVIEEHLTAQKLYSAQKWAVLGNFVYPVEARKRALTHFFCTNSFMFPQVDMEEGCPYGYSHFITCNLSIRREAVLQVGSFDGTYMLSEDTEMGIKLFERGYSVVYHPAAHAWHDHVQYVMPNLLRRARVYGQDYFYMFRKHPRVLREWAMPIKLTAMDPSNGFLIRDYVDKHRPTIKSVVAALERWDDLDFEPILADPENERHVLALFQQSVPAVHWFYLFERMLEVMAVEFNMPELVSPEAVALHATAK